MAELPYPLGSLDAHRFDAKGIILHDFNYVNSHPDKLFTKYLLWWIEINDELIDCICPSDLAYMPCEWDEIPGGCPMMRLCQVKHNHTLLFDPNACCKGDYCQEIHNVAPNCRSIARALQNPPKEGEVKFQTCEKVAWNKICQYGHDLESARIRAVYNYWEHREAARARGSCGLVRTDVLGRLHLTPLRPADLEEAAGAN